MKDTNGYLVGMVCVLVALTAGVLVGAVGAVLLAVAEEAALHTAAVSASQEAILT